MKITILGSGTSGGVPMISCNCIVCKSSDTKDKRLRSSILIEINQLHYIFDTGPDFRQQMLRENVHQLDAVIFTHAHRDHTAGLDDVRAFNYFQKKPMPVFCTKETYHALQKEYHYVFEDKKYPGLPELTFHFFENKTFSVFGIEMIPIEVLHLNMQVFGFRIGDFTYITDANFISEQELEKIKGSKILIINALRKQKHISHFTLNEALQIIEKVKPKIAYLTHISHQMGMHEEVQLSLPENVFIAYDGLILDA